MGTVAIALATTAVAAVGGIAYFVMSGGDGENVPKAECLGDWIAGECENRFRTETWNQVSGGAHCPHQAGDQRKVACGGVDAVDCVVESLGFPDTCDSNNQKVERIKIVTQQSGGGAKCRAPAIHFCEESVDCVGEWVTSGDCVSGKIEETFTVRKHKKGGGSQVCTQTRRDAQDAVR